MATWVPLSTPSLSVNCLDCRQLNVSQTSTPFGPSKSSFAPVTPPLCLQLWEKAYKFFCPLVSGGLSHVLPVSAPVALLNPTGLERLPTQLSCYTVDTIRDAWSFWRKLALRPPRNFTQIPFCSQIYCWGF